MDFSPLRSLQCSHWREGSGCSVVKSLIKTVISNPWTTNLPLHLYKWDKYKLLWISAYHKCKCPHASYIIPGIGSKSLGELLIGYQSKFPFSFQCNLSNTFRVNSTTEHPKWPSTPFLISCFLVFTRLRSIFSSQLQCFKEKGAQVRTIAHVCFYLDSRNLLEPGVTNNWMASVCLF